MYNSQDIANRIKLRAKNQGYSISTVLSACKLGKNTVTKISQGTDILTLNLAKIADYLDCSIDYLLGRTDIQEIETFIRAPDNTKDYIVTTNKPEATLLIEFRNLNKQGQEYIMQTMDMVKDKYKKSSSISGMEAG